MTGQLSKDVSLAGRKRLPWGTEINTGERASSEPTGVAPQWRLQVCRGRDEA